MSDPSFEKSRREEYYAIYFETKMLSIAIISLFFIVFFKYFRKVFCKGPWLVYTTVI